MLRIASDGSQTHTITGKLSGEAWKNPDRKPRRWKASLEYKRNNLWLSTSVINPDGTSTHKLKAEVGASGGVKRDTTLEDGSKTQQIKGDIGLGDEVAIAADGSQTHTLTGSGKVSADSSQTTNHDDGKETTKLSGETGTRVKHVLGDDVTKLDIDSKVAHTTSGDQKLSDTVTETNTTGHTATLSNDPELNHGAEEGEEYNLGLNPQKNEGWVHV